MARAQKITDLLSPSSWLVFLASFWPSFFLFFRPNLKEFALLFVVDFVALGVMTGLDRWAFPRLYPNCRSYFPVFKAERFAGLSLQERIETLRSLIAFPKRRAIYCFLTSYLKTFPAMLVIVFAWDYEGGPAAQLLKVLIYSSLTFTFFFAAVFFETHEMISTKIREIHERHDWTEAFRRIQLPRTVRLDRLADLPARVGIWSYMLAFQATLIITQPPSKSPDFLALEVAAVGILSFVLVSMLFFLHRRFVMGGIEQVFNHISTLGTSNQPQPMPLHTYPMLATFEQSVNALLFRLRDYEQELTHWIFRESEHSRHAAMGEISGLVVHDMSAPLHVVRFCSDQIRENPDLARDPRYIDKLTSNVRRSIELIDSLRAYLKSPELGNPRASLKDAHSDALRLLGSQLLKDEMSRLKIELAPELSTLQLRLPRADLIHVLLNLYSIRAGSLTDPRISEPRLEISLVSLEKSQVVIRLMDNGKPISSEEFERLTAFSYSSDESGEAGRELGLRLVRRLIERYEGSLDYENSRQNEPGTAFLLRLPVAEWLKSV